MLTHIKSQRNWEEKVLRTQSLVADHLALPTRHLESQCKQGSHTVFFKHNSFHILGSTQSVYTKLLGVDWKLSSDPLPPPPPCHPVPPPAPREPDHGQVARVHHHHHRGLVPAGGTGATYRFPWWWDVLVTNEQTKISYSSDFQPINLGRIEKGPMAV